MQIKTMVWPSCILHLIGVSGGGVAYRGEGITSVKFILVPCGVNVPHTHPRATEVLNVVEGGPLLVGWVNTSGSKSFD